MADDAVPFPYMRWARAHLPSDDPLSLGLSGLPRPSPRDLAPPGPRLPDGRDPETLWVAALGDALGLAPDQVHPAAGASHANFLVWLAFARGGHVAVETPTYEAFLRLGAAVGATTATFDRDPARDWRIDPDGLRAATPPGTRLLVVTDLHNPSGRRLHPDDLELLLETARSRDALVLVDEVYRDLDPLDRATAAGRDERILVTSSLTKSHGLWDLRAGWVAGPPERIREVVGWDDLVCPRLSMAAYAQALDALPSLRERVLRTRDRCEVLTARVARWVASRDDVTWSRPDAGFTAFLFLGREGRPLDGDEVARRAWEEHQVRVVPGRFFQRRHGIRISYYRGDDALEQALDGLSRTLDALSGARPR